jgi:hypothetical protein
MRSESDQLGCPDTRIITEENRAAATGLGAVAALSLVGGSAFAYQPVQHDLYVAQNPSSCNKSPCILYPKSTELPSGRLVASFEDSEGSVVGQKLPIYKSDDHGDTWQKLSDVLPPASLSSDPAYAVYTSNWTNPYFYVLPQDLGSLKAGTLLLASVVSGPDQSTNGSNRTPVAIALYASQHYCVRTQPGTGPGLGAVPDDVPGPARGLLL